LVIGQNMARPLRVLALTTTNSERHQTWWLRVKLLLPLLKEQQIDVVPCKMPRDRRQRRALFDRLRGFDIAWVHRALLWPSELRRLRPVARRLVLDIDDPVCYSSSNWGNFSLARCLKFRATARACHAVLAASDGQVALARAHNRQVHFVPLCADPAAYSMQPRERLAGEPLRLLWLGARSTFKYLEQIRPQLEAVGNACPRVELVVVGHSSLALTSLPVVNLAWNRVVERQQLDRCHVGLSPMARDRWTQAKAALKPLQYLASGMPFVGSPVGINLRLVDQDRNGLLADSPAEWVAAIQQLEVDETRRREMGRHGVDYIRRYHAPDVLASQVAHIFHSLCSEAVAA
jgi:glycosyltransferase involved in cell wall biosynthesis